MSIHYTHIRQHFVPVKGVDLDPIMRIYRLILGVHISNVYDNVLYCLCVLILSKKQYSTQNQLHALREKRRPRSDCASCAVRSEPSHFTRSKGCENEYRRILVPPLWEMWLKFNAAGKIFRSLVIMIQNV